MWKTMTQPPEIPERDLTLAGSVVDKAIEHLVGKNVSPVAIASALLGGAMGVLSHTLPDDVILQILGNAMESVESGDLRKTAGRDTAGNA
jgi:hypothetical protein